MGYLVWCSLSSEIQDILHPFLYSHCTADNAPKKRTIPIYKLDRRLTFHHWIISFVGHLVEKVEDGLAKRVFNACSVMFKYYSQVPLFLLPFVVIKVLCSQKPDTDVCLHSSQTACNLIGATLPFLLYTCRSLVK